MTKDDKPIRRTTMADIGRLAGVDISTVSRALKDDPRIPSGTRDQIRKVVEETGYVVNHSARTLRSRWSGQILVMLPNISATFYPEVVEGIEDITSERGLNVLVGSTRGSVEREEALAHQLLNGVVDGLILLNGNLPKIVHRMIDYDRRVVAVSRPVGDARIPMVSIDHGRAMQVAVQHLLLLGHRHIAHIAGPQTSPTFRVRAQSYCQALAAEGLAPQMEIAPQFDLNGGYEAMTALLAPASGGRSRPTAVICASDEAAIGAMSATRAGGLSVPSDIAFIGFDGIAMGAVSEPPLSTIRIPRREMGRAGATMLLHNIEAEERGPKVHELEFELVVRGSCGAASSRVEPAVMNRSRRPTVRKVRTTT